MKHLNIVIKIKDPVSALSHCIGILLGVAFLFLLVIPSALEGRSFDAIAFAAFAISTILVYTASTLYHWLPLTVSKEKLFRDIDQSAIFLMIAGTYTPVCVVVLPSQWGIPLLICIWILALVGIGLLWLRRRNRSKIMTNRRWATALIYLTMGWIALIALYPLSQNFSAIGITWLIAGGIAYSIGAFCYGIKHPNPIPGVIEYHEVFHIFVLLGTLCHFWMIYQYILPIPAISASPAAHLGVLMLANFRAMNHAPEGPPMDS